MAIPIKALETLRNRRKKIIETGDAEKIKKRHDKGLLTARERLDRLFQEGTFQELGAHMQHRCNFFGMETKEIPSDGVIVGTGYVDGRQVAAASQDFLAMAGTLGKMHATKIVAGMEIAKKVGIPLVAFKDSGGARIQEAVDALSGYGEVFYQNVLLSGVVPQIAVILGPCAGGASYSPALMDFIIMTRENAQMFITGPQVIKAVSGRECTMDEVGGATMHASVSGNVHFIADDDEHAIEICKELLSFLPNNNTQDPPHQPYPELDMSDDAEMANLVPEDPKEAMDVTKVIERLVDDGHFLQVHELFAQNLITCFARIQGIVVGILANQSKFKAGCLDIDASDKGARFIRFCNAFNIPIVNLVDVPGFLPGIEQERGGIIRHGAKLLFAYSASTVPKLTIILRKAYGGSYLAMCSQEMGADVVLAWPTAEIAVMGAEGALNILYRKELDEAKDKKARSKELIEEYREKFASPYLAAGRGYITDVIEPGQTRGQVALSLRKLLNKRDLRPLKKHGNIPL
ncbi:MAG: acyl-CoA carboxylase subunit beta [Nitrospirae bacterium]|nr:acyl-CoA carboxylase subunit beta [Magnetococcales bacterium]HAT48705.1 methylmalonyl-CoA carboxyltransferase [Alphaproteobacteria bacterium]